MAIRNSSADRLCLIALVLLFNLQTVNAKIEILTELIKLDAIEQKWKNYEHDVSSRTSIIIFHANEQSLFVFLGMRNHSHR